LATHLIPALVNAITDVPGIRVGHAQDEDAITGCTVILADSPDGPGAVGGVDQRGGAPGTRQIDALHPVHLVQKAHAIVLAGGSAFGLEAATGVARWLEKRGIGFDVRVAKVPIVPAAILFDLAIGRADMRPDATMGYRACEAAGTARPAEGNVGAGLGCTVGKILGPAYGMKSGIGTASVDLGGGLIVGAIMAVNAFGDVIDPENGHIIAGVRSPEGAGFADTLTVMKQNVAVGQIRFARQSSSSLPPAAGNTVIGVIATNAKLDKEQANKVAQMAHDGLARTIRPAHTMLDGDTLFALATGAFPADVNSIGAFAAEVTAQAILNGVRAAKGLAGWPAAQDF
jgi:L-aminopeptidase/D-esterase-like protein